MKLYQETEQKSIDTTDPFSLSPERRHKMIAEYAKQCPFIGEYLNESELVALIQQALHINKSHKQNAEKLNLLRNEKVATFQCKIADSPLSEGIKTALKGVDIVYIGDLCTKNKRYIQDIRGIGTIRIREIQKLLTTLDVSFGLDPNFWNDIYPGKESNIKLHTGDSIGVRRGSNNTILSLLSGGR